MGPEFFDRAAQMDNLLVLTREQAAATAAYLRRLAALERENARLLEALNRIGADTCENCIKGEQAIEALEATDDR